MLIFAKNLNVFEAFIRVHALKRFKKREFCGLWSFSAFRLHKMLKRQQEFSLKTSILNRCDHVCTQARSRLSQTACSKAAKLSIRHVCDAWERVRCKNWFFADQKANFNKLTQKKNLVSQLHVDGAQIFFIIKHKIDLWYIFAFNLNEWRFGRAQFCGC